LNKIIIAVGITALLVIAGIVVYQFAQQQYAIHTIASQIDAEKKVSEYLDCLKGYDIGNEKLAKYKDGRFHVETNETAYDKCKL